MGSLLKLLMNASISLLKSLTEKRQRGKKGKEKEKQEGKTKREKSRNRRQIENVRPQRLQPRSLRLVQ